MVGGTPWRYSDFYRLHRLTLFWGQKIFNFNLFFGLELFQLFFWVYKFAQQFISGYAIFWQVFLVFKIRHLVINVIVNKT